jgi:hypothetical protein
MSQPTSEPSVSPAIACTLGSAELGTQAQRWRILYAEAGIRRTVTSDGLRVSFRPGSAVEDELRALVAIELECCGWAEWSIGANPGELTLEISSTGDGIAMIHGWLLDG